MGKIPEQGDSFTFENIEVEVTETDSHRVAFAKVTRLPEETEEEEKAKDKDKEKDKDEQLGRKGSARYPGCKSDFVSGNSIK